MLTATTTLVAIRRSLRLADDGTLYLDVSEMWDYGDGEPLEWEGPEGEDLGHIEDVSWPMVSAELRDQLADLEREWEAGR